jgi:arabinose-5-phosphate isomerase
VLALSWSGETVELKNIVLHSRRFRIPLIAITSRATSTLACAADLALIVPRVADACAGGLAPTTSTLVQLAVGDALATALLDRCGFTADDFYRFHPGGLLGANLTRVRDVMHSGDRLPLVPVGTVMGEALLVMTRQRLGCVGVIDAHGSLVGIITDGDLRRHLGPVIFERRVEDVMTSDPKVIQPDTLVASVMETLSRNAITAAFVVEDRVPIGIVHLHDLLRRGAQ